MPLSVTARIAIWQVKDHRYAFWRYPRAALASNSISALCADECYRRAARGRRGRDGGAGGPAGLAVRWAIWAGCVRLRSLRARAVALAGAWRAAADLPLAGRLPAAGRAGAALRRSGGGR